MHLYSFSISFAFSHWYGFWKRHKEYWYVSIQNQRGNLNRVPSNIIVFFSLRILQFSAPEQEAGLCWSPRGLINVCCSYSWCKQRGHTVTVGCCGKHQCFTYGKDPANIFISTSWINIIFDSELHKQSGTKPKFWLPNLVFFVMYIMLWKYVKYESNNNVIKYYG